MGTINIQEMLEKSFGNSFEFHPDFYDEFEKLIAATGTADTIVKKLLSKLQMIIELGDIDYGLKWLEHLKAYGNLYSLHLKDSSHNFRLLFSKNKRGKLFLCAFYERSGKKNTSYEKYAKLAIERRDSEKKEGSICQTKRTK